MRTSLLKRLMRLSAIAAAAGASLSSHAQLSANDGVLPLPSGQFITPLAVPGANRQPLNPGLAAYPNFVAGMAVRSQLSPDGSTLAVITAGHNGLLKSDGAGGVTNDTASSGQYLFIYSVSGANRSAPVLTQVLQVPNAYVGLVFSPDGRTLYAGGGADDVVYLYTQGGGTWSTAGSIALGHNGYGLGLQAFGKVSPNAGSVALSADGATLVVANNYNDSISVVDTATRTVRYEHDLRPFAPGNEAVDGGVGGTFPYAVLVTGSLPGGNLTAYITSDRDREVDVVNITSAPGSLVTRIALDGNGMGMTLSADQSTLFVAQENADEVAVISTASNAVIEKIDARAPAGMLGATRYTGAATTAVTLSPDGSTLYAVNSGANSVAVIPLSGPAPHAVVGLIPTAYEPHDVTLSADGSTMYIINGKNATGPNPANLYATTSLLTSVNYPGGNAAAQTAAALANEYQFQLERSSLLTAPVPTATALPALTAQVAQNNAYSATPVANDATVMNFLSARIQHVIYIVKENRTFDQLLGDLTNGAQASAALAQFGKRMTPNYHRLASQFVTLDNFFNPGDGSMDGWGWSLQGRVTNTETITQQINYSNIARGLSYEGEATNRNVPVEYPTLAQRNGLLGGGTAYSNIVNAAAAVTPGGPNNLLIGGGNHAAADAPFGIQQGYIFDAVLNAGKTVRNYGFLTTNVGPICTNNSSTASCQATPIKNPYALGAVQAVPLDPHLAPFTDVFYRGFDQNYPDIWRFTEWNREFSQYVANGNLPTLTTLRISHDHTGSFATALGGFNTPDTQQADCDYTTGMIIQTLANSPYASNTLVFVVEDDVQDGPDHIDSHRGPAFVVGPYVKQGGVVVSTHYSQVNVLRTIEDILGTQHINLNTAFQRPMADVFDTTQSGAWTYTAVASTLLRSTTLAMDTAGSPLRYAEGPVIKPRHDAAYWARVTAGMNFAVADALPTAQFNRVLWTGTMGTKPYPTPHTQFAPAKDLDD